MPSSAKPAITIDRARHALCRFIEQWCEQGVSNVKVRVNTLNKLPQSVWFYGRVANAWKKLPEAIEGTQFASLIEAELARLATSSHTEECQVRRKSFLDRSEFEIKFHRDEITAHQGTKLGPYLFGILFYERHEAPNAKRQGIRRGAKSRARR